MDAQTELTMLETAYTTIISGGVSSYSINGRALTILDLDTIIKRMDILRAAVYRQGNGMFHAARNREPE